MVSCRNIFSMNKFWISQLLSFATKILNFNFYAEQISSMYLLQKVWKHTIKWNYFYLLDTPISPSFTPVDLLELQDRSRSFSLSFILSSSISFHPSPSLHHSLSIILSLSISISLYLCLSLSISLFFASLSFSFSLPPFETRKDSFYTAYKLSTELLQTSTHKHTNTQWATITHEQRTKKA